VNRQCNFSARKPQDFFAPKKAGAQNDKPQAAFLAVEAQAVPVDGGGGAAAIQIKESNRASAVALIGGPHRRVSTGDLQPGMCRLVNGNHLIVGEELQPEAIQVLCRSPLGPVVLPFLPAIPIAS